MATSSPAAAAAVRPKFKTGASLMDLSSKRILYGFSSQAASSQVQKTSVRAKLLASEEDDESESESESESDSESDSEEEGSGIRGIATKVAKKTMLPPLSSDSSSGDYGSDDEGDSGNLGKTGKGKEAENSQSNWSSGSKAKAGGKKLKTYSKPKRSYVSGQKFSQPK